MKDTPLGDELCNYSDEVSTFIDELQIKTQAQMTICAGAYVKKCYNSLLLLILPH